MFSQILFEMLKSALWLVTIFIQFKISHFICRSELINVWKCEHEKKSFLIIMLSLCRVFYYSPIFLCRSRRIPWHLTSSDSPTSQLSVPPSHFVIFLPVSELEYLILFTFIFTLPQPRQQHKRSFANLCPMLHPPRIPFTAKSRKNIYRVFCALAAMSSIIRTEG